MGCFYSGSFISINTVICEVTTESTGTKTGRRLLSLWVTLISQTVTLEEALPCTVQFCNNFVMIKEQSFEKWAISVSDTDSVCGERPCSSDGSCTRTNRNIYFRLLIPCLVSADFPIQPMNCTDLLCCNFYELCPLLRFKSQCPIWNPQMPWPWFQCC